MMTTESSLVPATTDKEERYMSIDPSEHSAEPIR
jgi:hypothetical protein